MKESALRDACLRVMGRDPMATGATLEEAKRELETYLQSEGAEARRMRQPCHCYDHCEDDDEGVTRRTACRKHS